MSKVNENRKGYKQTKLGWIPEDWVEIKLGNCLKSIVGGGTPSRDILKYWGGDIPWVTVKDLSSFNPNSAKEYINSLAVAESSSNLIPSGTLITSTRMALGKAVIYEVDVAINQDLKALFVKPKLDTKFLFYWFELNKFRIEVFGTGSTVKGIGLSDLRSFKLALPSNKEQQKIAKILTTWDKAIEKQEQLIAQKEALKKGLMQQLLTGKKRFPGFNHAWKEVRLGKVLKIGSGKDYKKLGNGNIPVYGTGGLMLHVDNWLYDGESVGIGRKGTIDKPMFLEGKFWTVDTLFYTHSFNSVTPKFIYYLFQRINWKLYNEASGVPSLSKNTIEKIKVKIPSKEEQNKIEKALSVMDIEIQKIKAELHFCKEQKKGLMQKLLTGEIRVKL